MQRGHASRPTSTGRLGEVHMPLRCSVCYHIRLAGASNGEERNWILISGRPTAAPHSSHDVLQHRAPTPAARQALKTSTE